MIFFILSISYLINPYLLILSLSITNLKLNKIYYTSLIFLYFIFFNLRTYDTFIYANTPDDSGDYIKASGALASRGTISSILNGEWDGPTEHIDRLFQLVQLFTSKIFPAEFIPLVFSILIGILFMITIISFPKTTSNLISINPKYIGSIIILNPYLIYINQHLFRQGVALGLAFATLIPSILKLFVKENYIKIVRSDYLIILFYFIVLFGLHRGSTIPLAGFFIISFLISQNPLSGIYNLFFKFTLKKKLIIVFFSITLFIIFILNSGKYIDQFVIQLSELFIANSDTTSTGLRTGIIGLIISTYGIYNINKSQLKYFFKKELKIFIFSYSFINALLSIITILTNFRMPRVLFSSSTILTLLILVSFKLNNLYLRLLTLGVGILTFNKYIFVKEGFWGMGHFILPYLQ